MKQIILGFTILLLFSNSYSQDLSLVKDKIAISKYKVKSISTIFNSISDLKDLNGLEIAKVEFNENGNVVYEKYFRLFDVILYSEEYNYTYNISGQLIEKIEIQKEYPKTKQDSSLLDITGYEPDTTKWTYIYDKDDNLIREFKFSNASDKNPTLKSIFEYNKNGNKVKGIFSNINFPNQTSISNRVEQYEYDKKNNLIKEIMNWTTSDVSHIKSYKYDKNGNKIFESIIHKSGRGNITKFIYLDNRLLSMERYKVNEKQWFNKTNYTYSENGYLMKISKESNSGGEWSETYEYNNKGLLEREYWYTREGQKAFYFNSNYQYY